MRDQLKKDDLFQSHEDGRNIRNYVRDSKVRKKNPRRKSKQSELHGHYQEPLFHAHTKHMEIQYHYVWELIDNETIQLEYYPTSENVANIFTKTL